VPIELDAVFTVGEEPVVCAAGCAVVVLEVLELLPHAARNTDAATRDATTNLAEDRIRSLPI